jgi:signal transduction histidine kinase
MRATGLRAEAEVTGQPRRLPAAVDLAAYRLAQEALTNVARHSAAVRAQVRVTYGGDWLYVQVDDDGPARQAPDGRAGAGHGILGMTERAASLGGALEAGPRPGGGYRVVARLPLGGTR